MDSKESEQKMMNCHSTTNSNTLSTTQKVPAQSNRQDGSVANSSNAQSAQTDSPGEQSSSVVRNPLYYSKNKDKRSCLYQSNKLRQLAALHERSAFYEKLLNGENIMKLIQIIIPDTTVAFETSGGCAPLPHDARCRPHMGADLSSAVPEDNSKWINKEERTSNQPTAKRTEAAVKIMRLASLGDHDYEHSDYADKIMNQYLTQLVRNMKKRFHSWILNRTVGKTNGITLQTDEQQAELIAQRLTAGIAFDHERNKKIASSTAHNHPDHRDTIILNPRPQKIVISGYVEADTSKMNDDTATFSSRLGADMTSDDEHKALVFTERRIKKPRQQYSNLPADLKKYPKRKGREDRDSNSAD